MENFNYEIKNENFLLDELYEKLDTILYFTEIYKKSKTDELKKIFTDLCFSKKEFFVCLIRSLFKKGFQHKTDTDKFNLLEYLVVETGCFNKLSFVEIEINDEKLNSKLYQNLILLKFKFHIEFKDCFFRNTRNPENCMMIFELAKNHRSFYNIFRNYDRYESYKYLVLTIKYNIDIFEKYENVFYDYFLDKKCYTELFFIRNNVVSEIINIIFIDVWLDIDNYKTMIYLLEKYEKIISTTTLCNFIKINYNFNYNFDIFDFIFKLLKKRNYNVNSIFYHDVHTFVMQHPDYLSRYIINTQDVDIFTFLLRTITDEKLLINFFELFKDELILY